MQAHRQIWHKWQMALFSSTGRGLGWPLLAGLVVFCVVSGYLAFWPAGQLAHSRMKALDHYIRLAPFQLPPAIAGQLVFVDIDEASLARLGQWPWPRSMLARLADRILAASPAVLGFDILLFEPDRFHPARLARLGGLSPAEWQEKMPGWPDGDQQLARSLAGQPTVLATMFAYGGGAGQTGGQDIEKPFVPAPLIAFGDLVLAGENGYLISPLPVLQSAAGAGFANLAASPDGLVRAMPVSLQLGGLEIPSLALEMLRLAGDGLPGRLRPHPFIPDEMRLKLSKQIWQLGQDRLVWLHHGPLDGIARLAAADLLAGGGDISGQIKGKMVIIGSSAAGLHDLKSTVLQANQPGVWLHIQMLGQLMAGRMVRMPGWLAALEWGFRGLAGFGLALAATRLASAGFAAGLTVFLAAGLAGQLWLFQDLGLVADYRVNMGLPAACALSSLLVRLAGEERRRRQLMRHFGPYLPAAMARQLARQPRPPQLGGTQQIVTVLFADLRRSTRLADQLLDQPAQLVMILNRLAEHLGQAVLAAGGTIDKFTGDGLMAFWNAPLPTPRHAAAALMAAEAMLDGMDRLNDQLCEDGLLTLTCDHRPPVQLARLSIGIGLATGPCIIGNMGSRQRFDYTALGRPVIAAARLQDLTKQMKQPLLIAGSTVRLLDKPAGLACLGPARLRGRAAPIEVWTRKTGHN